MKKNLFSLLICILLWACGNETNIKDMPVDITIQRFDLDLQTAASDTAQIPALRKRYGTFLEYFSRGLIGIGNSRSTEYARLLDNFAHSPVVREAYRKTEESFPDVTWLNNELTSGFKYLLYYFPDILIPRVYSYVSGFNEAVMLTDSILGIGLDRFLGDTCKIYDRLAFPKYQQYNMRPARIPIVCLQSWLASEYVPENGGEGNLLQQMMYEGKLLYVTKQCFPKAADTLITGFTTKQLAWCVDNEAKIWEHLLENQLLYNNNQFTVQKFVGEAPFTSAFTPEAPGRAVNWLAWRIVDAYMKKNKITLPELMELESQVILKEVRYKP